MILHAQQINVVAARMKAACISQYFTWVTGTSDIQRTYHGNRSVGRAHELETKCGGGKGHASKGRSTGSQRSSTETRWGDDVLHAVGTT